MPDKKELEFISYLNKEFDNLLDNINHLKEAYKDNDNYEAYCSGYAVCIRDFKKILLEYLENEEVVYGEKKSS